MTDSRRQSHEALQQSHAEYQPHEEDSGLVPLEAVLSAEKLRQRPSRAPDFQTENRALVTLAQALADSPRSVFQTLADIALEVFKAGSAGVSLLSKDQKSFFWPAVAGLWHPHIGGGTPRNFSPCGDVLDCNALVQEHALEGDCRLAGTAGGLLRAGRAAADPASRALVLYGWILATNFHPPSGRRLSEKCLSLSRSLAFDEGMAWALLRQLRGADGPR